MVNLRNPLFIFMLLSTLSLGPACHLICAADESKPEYAIPAPQPFHSNAATDQGFDGAPHLAADGRGNWVAVWESFDSLGGTKGDDLDILVSRSSDGGATWTQPTPLALFMLGDSAFDDAAKIATDEQGNWVVVWYSQQNLGGTIGDDFDILSSFSTDNGGTWSEPIAVGSNATMDGGAIDDWPEISTDRKGNWLAIWRSTDSLQGTIGGEGDILCARSTDHGRSWLPVAPVNTNAATDMGDDAFPQIATDGLGNWVAIWVSTDSLGGTVGADRDILFARSENAGSGWSAPQPLNSSATVDRAEDAFPQIITDSAGLWVAIWESDDSARGGAARVMISHSTDSGHHWAPMRPLSTLAAPSGKGPWANAQLATDGRGLWAALWTSLVELPDGGNLDLDLLFALSNDRCATWSAPMLFNTHATTTPGEDVFSQLKTDGLGRWIALWSSTDSLGGTIGADHDILITRFETDSLLELLAGRMHADRRTHAAVRSRPHETIGGPVPMGALLAISGLVFLSGALALRRRRKEW